MTYKIEFDKKAQKFILKQLKGIIELFIPLTTVTILYVLLM